MHTNSIHLKTLRNLFSLKTHCSNSKNCQNLSLFMCNCKEQLNIPASSPCSTCSAQLGFTLYTSQSSSNVSCKLCMLLSRVVIYNSSVVTVLKISSVDGFGWIREKSADSDSVSDSRRRHHKPIYTGHRAQRLSTGGRQMWRRYMSQAIGPRSFLAGTDATQPRADAPCARQQCRGHNHLGRSPERPGHFPTVLPSEFRVRIIQICVFIRIFTVMFTKSTSCRSLYHLPVTVPAGLICRRNRCNQSKPPHHILGRPQLRCRLAYSLLNVKIKLTSKAHLQGTSLHPCSFISLQL